MLLVLLIDVTKEISNLNYLKCMHNCEKQAPVMYAALYVSVN
jgi:hypothetical protein